MKLERDLLQPVGDVDIIDAFDIDGPSVGMFARNVCWARLIGGDRAGDGSDH